MADERMSARDASTLVSGNMLEVLGMKIERLDPDCVVMTMPVDDRTRQPFGYLHGGASVALAETAASIGTWQYIDLERQAAFGIEINANHVRSKREGVIRATATPLHKGRTIMVWDIRICDEDGRLVCVSRCTVAIVERRDHSGSSVQDGG
ncbi:esterase [Alicyclobacillus cellulosilyticus]|uniref:Esterase n=1 Tax=Alicyclobacillus cellulosilyticus TaxID=1003997 RepID=A0A917K4M2_9BACL|nr:esterase [Alicyclobacillus cellulosilyticus]